MALGMRVAGMLRLTAGANARLLARHDSHAAVVMPASPERPEDVEIAQEVLPANLRTAKQPFPAWTGYFPDTYCPPKEYGIQTKMPKDFKEFPERDIVNFPHPEKPDFPQKVRLGIFPDQYFQFFYNKTGVTGPYLFGGGVVCFLWQKEILVMDHFGMGIIPLYVAWTLLNKVLSPYAKSYLDDKTENELRNEKAAMVMDVHRHENTVAAETECQSQYPGVMEHLYAAKKEAIALQLEAAFRQRIASSYSEVKRRLDYLVEVESAKRRFEYRHMVDWIIDQVKAGITPDLEKAALQQCVLDLKTLAKTA